MDDFLENDFGVHLFNCGAGHEFTACGIACDNDDEDVGGELLPTDKTKITCENCRIAIEAWRERLLMLKKLRSLK